MVSKAFPEHVYSNFQSNQDHPKERRESENETLMFDDITMAFLNFGEKTKL